MARGRISIFFKFSAPACAAINIRVIAWEKRHLRETFRQGRGV
jgi:hypothetical protein